jgi:hypothetical protein
VLLLLFADDLAIGPSTVTDLQQRIGQVVKYGDKYTTKKINKREDVCNWKDSKDNGEARACKSKSMQ